MRIFVYLTNTWTCKRTWIHSSTHKVSKAQRQNRRCNLKSDTDVAYIWFYLGNRSNDDAVELNEAKENDEENC